MTTLYLRALTLEECQQVRIWRNAPDALPMLRMGFKTEAEQAAFFRDVVSNPDADHRYFAIIAVEDGTETFIGMGGLTYLSRVRGEGEISLILGPTFRGRGYGFRAVQLLVAKAKALGLCCVVGECYRAGAWKFWQDVVHLYVRSIGRWYGDRYWFWILTGDGVV